MVAHLNIQYILCVGKLQIWIVSGSCPFDLFFFFFAIKTNNNTDEYDIVNIHEQLHNDYFKHSYEI